MASADASQPCWISVFPTSLASQRESHAFVVVRCHRADAWQQTVTSTAHHIPETSSAGVVRAAPRKRAEKRRRIDSPTSLETSLALPRCETLGDLEGGLNLSLGELDGNERDSVKDDFKARDKVDICASDASDATCASDVLELLLMECVGDEERDDTGTARPEEATTARVRVFSASPRGQSVSQLVPRGMSTRTYCALLDASVRQQACRRAEDKSRLPSPAPLLPPSSATATGPELEGHAPSSASSYARAPGEADSDGCDDGTVLSVKVRTAQQTADAANPVAQGGNHVVELSLTSTSSESAVLLWSCDVRLARPAPDMPSATSLLRRVWRDVSVPLRRHEAVQVLVANQRREIAQLRQRMETLVAARVREDDVEPLKAMQRIVNTKKTRIVELTATVAALRQQLQTAHSHTNGAAPADPNMARTEMNRLAAQQELRAGERPEAAATRPLLPLPPSPSPQPGLPAHNRETSSSETQDTTSPLPTDDDDDADTRTGESHRADGTSGSQGRSGKTDWLSDLFAL